MDFLFSSQDLSEIIPGCHKYRTEHTESLGINSGAVTQSRMTEGDLILDAWGHWHLIQS